MQLESLKIFCDVARHRSFSHAAELHDMTQSAVSQIVSQLEKRMKVQLIDRSTRPLQLTPLGVAYFEGCKLLLDQYDELEARIRSAQVDIEGEVTVAAIYSVSLSDMGQYVQRFQAELPKAKVHIDYLHPDRVYERVMDGTADLGLVSCPRKTPNLVSIGWREEEMVLVCSPRHSLASRSALPIKELNRRPYVHFDRNLVVRRRVDKFLREHHVEVEVVAEFDSIENIKQAVSIDAGIALLPEPTVRREVMAGILVAVSLFDGRLTRPLAIIHRRGQRLKPAAKRFIELLLASDATHRNHGAHPSGANGKASRGA